MVEHLRPELGRDAVAQRHRHDAGVHHLQNVRGLEVFVGRLHDDRRLTFLLESLVQRGHEPGKHAGGRHIHGLPGEVVDARHRRRVRARDGNDLDLVAHRIRKVDEPLPLSRDAQAGGGDITAAVDQRLEDFVAANRNEHEGDRGRPGLHLRVDRRFELPHRIVGRPSHRLAVEEEIHLVRDHQDADEATGHHAVEIAAPGRREQPAFGRIGIEGRHRCRLGADQRRRFRIAGPGSRRSGGVRPGRLGLLRPACREQRKQEDRYGE